MTGRRRCLLLYAVTLAFQCILALVAQAPNSITQPSQPSLVGASHEAPLAFKVSYRYIPGGKTFDRTAFMNTMIRGVGAMTKWPWNSATSSPVELPSRFGISMKFLPVRSGTGLFTKQIAWTIEEIFDILVEHGRYSVGTFQVNANWDEDTVGFGSLAVATPGVNTIAAMNLTDTDPLIGVDVESKVLPVNHTSDEQTTTPSLSSSKRTLDLDTTQNLRLLLTYPPNGALYHDTQIYNATLKTLIQTVAGTDPLFPMVATYNDMDKFTLSIRSVSVEKGEELTFDQAGRTLAWFPMSTEKWGQQEGVITIGGKARGIFCIDPGDRTDFFRSTRCNPDLSVV